MRLVKRVDCSVVSLAVPEVEWERVVEAKAVQEAWAWRTGATQPDEKALLEGARGAGRIRQMGGSGNAAEPARISGCTQLHHVSLISRSASSSSRKVPPGCS